jgi:hypothetical protein
MSEIFEVEILSLPFAIIFPRASAILGREKRPFPSLILTWKHTIPYFVSQVFL